MSDQPSKINDLLQKFIDYALEHDEYPIEDLSKSEVNNLRQRFYVIRRQTANEAKRVGETSPLQFLGAVVVDQANGNYTLLLTKNARKMQKSPLFDSLMERLTDIGVEIKDE